MGKKKSSAQKEEVAVTAEQVPDDGGADDDEDEEEEVELLQIDLGDMAKMKQVLDEAVAAAVLEHVEEDYHWDNFKLGLMFAACLFACTAQFAPVPFPDCRPILGVCGALYFITSGILQLVTTLVDKDSILLTQPVSAGGGGGGGGGGAGKPAAAAAAKKTTATAKRGKNKWMDKYGIRVRSNMPRFSEFYSVILEFQMSAAERAADAAASAAKTEQKWSVGRFFDKEGYFDEMAVQEEVDKLFQRFEEGKYDDPTAETSTATEEKKKQ